MIRVVLSILNYNLGLNGIYKSSDTQPDAMSYSGNAFYIAHVLRGFDYSKEIIREPFLANIMDVAYATYHGKLPVIGDYFYGFYVGLLGVFYSWIGFSPVAVKIINGLFGCLSIIVVYYIARKLFETELTARLAVVLFAFFPSIVYWSVTALRDTLINFIFLLYLLSLVNFIKVQRKIWFLVSFVMVYFISLLRQEVSPLLIGGILLVVVLYFLTKVFMKKSFGMFAIIFILVYLSPVIMLINRDIALSPLVNKINHVVNRHIGNANSYRDATFYKIYPDFVYTAGKLGINDICSVTFVFSIIKSWLYYFFSPFPWSRWTKNFLPFYPQSVYTIILAPLVFLGGLHLFRKDILSAFLIFCLLIFIVTPYALAEGLMGIAFRHKDMFVPFGLILASHSLVKLTKKC